MRASGENGKYVDILVQTLQKKQAILTAILQKNKTQSMLLAGPDYDEEAIGQNFREKGELVDRLLELDDGFETLYKRVQSELEATPETYRAQIVTMQELITKITGDGTRIEAQEARNKTLADQYFAKQGENVVHARNRNRVTSAYKMAMNAGISQPAQFLDRKK